MRKPGRRCAARAVKYVDETGWRQAGQRRWLWTAATARVACFAVQVKRTWRAACGPAGAARRQRDHLQRPPLGLRPPGRATPPGLLGPPAQRDFVKWGEKGDKTRLLGDDGAVDLQEPLRLWRDFRQRNDDRPPAIGHGALRARSAAD